MTKRKNLILCSWVGRDGTAIRYLARNPVDDSEIPDGQVVVHNHLRPRMHFGRSDFRGWLQVPTDCLVPCDCDWGPHLKTHYRVKR